VIKRVNPIAKSMAHNRRRTSTHVEQQKKGKGSYNRNKENENARKHESSETSGTKATD